MMSSNNVYRRARPAFGTILRLEIESAVDAGEVLTRAFALAEELEQIFSKFRSDSDLSRLNFSPVGSTVAIPNALGEVLQLALELFALTDGAFNPYLAGCGDVQIEPQNSQWYAIKAASGTLDLSGIAKGYAVDKICELIHKELPRASGVVNAGGDLRFINTTNRDVAIRGSRETSCLRQVRVQNDGVATSSFSECRGNPLSSTIYHASPRANLDETCSVTVTAPNCAVADALTKAVWFGSQDVIPICMKTYDAQILILDGHGEVREQYA